MRKQFPGTFQVCQIVGGDVDDPAPDLSGNMKCWSPTEHNPNNYPKENLPFSTILQTADKGSQSTFGGVLDRGSMVLATKADGGYPVILGAFRDTVNPSKTVPGNRSLSSPQGDYTGHNKGTGMLEPTQLVEKMVGGVKIRERKPPREYKPSSIEGLPSNAALWQMAGQRWPQLKNIETAKQHFNEVITSDMIGQLAGKAMSLASMFSGMSASQKKVLKDNVPPELLVGMENMMRMMPGIESSEFITDFRVHEETFMQNAVDLLSQVKTLGDLQEALQILQSDESIRGLDKLGDLELHMEGPFGNTTLTISSSGSSSSKQADGAKEIFDKFASFLSSAASAPGINKGQNMFGKYAGTITDMTQRLDPQIQGKIKEVIEKVNNPQGLINSKVAELIQTDGAKFLSSAIPALKGLA